MLSGYYTISSGLLTRQRELDIIGNNLVNARTPGYQAQRAVSTTFDMELLIRQQAEGQTVLGPGYASVEAIVDDVIDIYGQGSVDDTGLETDLAIGGEGFFNIAGEGGTYLTRNGNFQIDEEGYLALEGYGRLLNTAGAPIRVMRSGFTVSSFGDVFGADGQNLGRIRITAPNDGATLARLDNGMFVLEAGGGRDARDYQIAQNHIEYSNVDMNREMTYLIQSQRAFQSCSSALQIIDSMNQKATKIASV